jgi:ribosomal protein S18 acetylase RimI-like enzyme
MADREPGQGALPPVRVRRPRDGDDQGLARALGAWMSPERVAALLPPGSLARFADTSAVAEDADGEVVGFLIALVSPTAAEVGYVHFVWVSPEVRGHGVGRRLYLAAADLLRVRGCRMLEAVTSPRNQGAIAFHQRLGFTVAAPGAEPAGADLHPEEGVVLLTRAL